MEKIHTLTAEEIMKRDEYRKGKWTVEEERYTAKLIEMFNAGLLPPTESQGKTLRVYLAEKLNCDPMRITKKFTGKLSLGKKLYSEAPPSSENEQTEEMRKELHTLEVEFLKKVEETQCRPRGRQLPELDVQSILHPPASNIYMTNDFYKPNVYNFLPMKSPMFPASYYYINAMENQTPRSYYEPDPNSPRYAPPFNVPNFNPTAYPNPYMDMSSAYRYGYPSYYAPMGGGLPPGASSHPAAPSMTIPQNMPPFPYYPTPPSAAPRSAASNASASTMPPQQCLNSEEESNAAFVLLGLMQRPSAPHGEASPHQPMSSNTHEPVDLSEQISPGASPPELPPDPPVTTTSSTSTSSATTSNCTTESNNNSYATTAKSAVTVSIDDDISPRTPMDLLDGGSATVEQPAKKRARSDDSAI